MSEPTCQPVRRMAKTVRSSCCCRRRIMRRRSNWRNTRGPRSTIWHEGSKIKDNVTASFGVSTTMPDDTGAGETLMGLADKALYMAKEQGRNQVVSESLVGSSAVAGE